MDSAERSVEGRFAGRTLIVTGCGSGIGRATALRAAREGAAVVVSDILQDVALSVVAQIGSLGGQATAHVGDLSRPEACADLVRHTVKEYGRLDAAVNNIGIMQQPSIPCGELEDTDWHRLRGVNLDGLFYCCREQLKALRSQGRGGVIVNVVSIAGLTGLAGCPAYVATTHAAVGLTRNIAIDYARYGIRCNAICPAAPGPALEEEANRSLTDLVVQARLASPAGGIAPQLPSGLQGALLLGRTASPQDQAAAILWLASDDASFVTGLALPLDGGMVS
jgi:NAD(P)-dependent dehydrogenase (short-subunit alcohol dehydrogenase family)